MADTGRGLPPIQPRKIGFLLGVGIFLLPYLFAWVLLRKGYSARARIVSFGWLALIVLVAASSQAPTNHSTPATQARESEAYATGAGGENAIRSMMKDPDSAVFTETEGRIKGGMHVACGYVNGKNSFGALAGKAPWLVIVETKVAMIQSYDNQSKFNPLWNKYCVGPDDGSAPKKSAPDTFRGVKWDAPLISAQKLRKTALKGCASIVEQKDLISNAPCSHLHINNDDIDTFAQRQNVAPLFDVPISEQTLSWSYKKFWAGDVYIYNYNDADLTKLHSALVEHYGSPMVTNDSQHLTEWDWTDKKIKIRLTFDPVPKPDIGGGTPKTSIWLHFVKE